MSNYILNDVGYDNMPIKIIDPLQESNFDEKELLESIEKNRKLIEQMRNSDKYKELI